MQDAKPINIRLQHDPQALSVLATNKPPLMYMPSSVQLTGTKPAGVTKEPTYKGKPGYGEVKVGNGPKSTFIVVLDQEETAGKLYIDQNQNGDFTDDPAASWNRAEPKKEGQMPSYSGSVVFKASYRTGNKTWTSPYGLNFYWSPGRSQIGYYRAGWSTGAAEIGGQRVAFKLLENGNTGVFDGRFDTAKEPHQLRPVTLFINEAQRDTRGTFEWNDVNYLATVSVDGTSVTLTPTMKVVKAPARPEVARKELLAPGTPAPDFTVEAFKDGKPVQLSDYKGKIVVLKFWASWCGPCIASMPHFEKLYRTVKDQGVEVLAVCVSDEKPAYQQWMKSNKDNYSYPFFFDPAGKTPNQSISGRLYNVSGIPTVFIIDKEGKVSESIVGYSEGDTRVDQALAKLGVSVK
jgi:peroxiredoxin